jgi:glycosyltransferase involved in cell wall biosynthesis
MPVYNGAAHLTEALESIGRQTLGDFEAIVVDDGSTDGTPQILADWARRDPRFQIVRHPANQNVACARNTGLALARSALVLHADADDVNAPERFAAQARAAERHPAMAVIGAGMHGKGGRIWRYPATSAAIRARMLWECPFGQNVVLFNRAVLGDIRYDPALSVCEDADLWLRCVFRHPTMNLPDPLVFYREHAVSLSHDVSGLRLRLDRLVMARRGAILGLAIDLDAGLACHLGNRLMAVGAARIAAHVLALSRRALALGLAPASVLRAEGRRRIHWLWRWYGRRQMSRELPALLAATTRLWLGLAQLKDADAPCDATTLPG